MHHLFSEDERQSLYLLESYRLEKVREIQVF